MEGECFQKGKSRRQSKKRPKSFRKVVKSKVCQYEVEESVIYEEVGTAEIGIWEA